MTSKALSRRRVSFLSNLHNSVSIRLGQERYWFGNLQILGIAPKRGQVANDRAVDAFPVIASTIEAETQRAPRACTRRELPVWLTSRSQQSLPLLVVVFRYTVKYPLSRRSIAHDRVWSGRCRGCLGSEERCQRLFRQRPDVRVEMVSCTE